MAEEQDLIALQSSINREQKRETSKENEVDVVRVTFYHDLVAGGVAGTAR